MGFLQRSKSAAITEQKTKKKDEKVAELNDMSMSEGQEKTSKSYERPKPADRPPSFSRPRTANAAIGRSTDFHRPVFKIDFKAGDEIFSFPTPSPRLPPPQSSFGPIGPSPLREPESHAIGVAIGSPSQPIPPWIGPLIEDYDSNLIPAPLRPTRPPPAIPEHPDLEIPLTDVRRRKANWKTFGGLFSRKTTRTASKEPFDKLSLLTTVTEQPANTVQHEALHDLPMLPAGSTSQIPSRHQRSPSLTRGQARFKARAEADKASFMPTGQPKILRSPSMIQKEGLSPMFRSIQAIPEESPWVDDLRKDSPLSMMSTKSVKINDSVETIAVPGTPTLVLDLPDPRFERYSIMFEKILEASKPSLLERRQSKLRRNTSVKKLDLPASNNDQQEVPRLEVNGVPQRSATSPGLKKSLSVRIGKKMLSPVSEVFSALNRPRPVRRTKTVATLNTASCAKSSPSPKIALQSTSLSSPAYAEFALPPTPLTVTTISHNGSVEGITNDLALVHHDFERAEPTWDMMTSQPVEERRDPSTRVRSPADLEKQIVQVSVAKKISVSKAMMQVRTSMDNKQPLRPKMVELSKNRTSTFVVIESVEE